MDRFVNALKSEAGRLDQIQAQPRFGLVASVDAINATVRVMMQPESVLSGWLPLLSPWVGAGWGMSCPPAPGDQVLVLAQEGDADQRRHHARHPLPGPGQEPDHLAPAGELWLVHRSGSFLKLQNDGTVQISGDLHVAGDVYDRHGSLAGLRGHYNQHIHTDSRGGATSTTSAPD
jgi:phage baseplate assembly protein gpV